MLGGVGRPVDPAQLLREHAAGHRLALRPRAQPGGEPAHRLVHRGARRVGQLAAVQPLLPTPGGIRNSAVPTPARRPSRPRPAARSRPRSPRPGAAPSPATPGRGPRADRDARSGRAVRARRPRVSQWSASARRRGRTSAPSPGRRRAEHRLAHLAHPAGRDHHLELVPCVASSAYTRWARLLKAVAISRIRTKGPLLGDDDKSTVRTGVPRRLGHDAGDSEQKRVNSLPKVRRGAPGTVAIAPTPGRRTA